MKKKILQYILIIIFGLISCKKIEEVEKNVEIATVESTKVHNNLNISILLDLSDRISPEKYPNAGMEIFQRDLGYIKTVSSSFETHLKSSKIRKMNDFIQVFFEPEPMNKEINTISQKMKLSFDKNNITKAAISQITPTYVNYSSQIYDLALKDKTFVGSDIWTFFKNNAKDYCIIPNHRNILIILTDGYLYHKDNVIKESNRTTYLTPEFINASKLNVSNYKDLMIQNKFGFIPATDSLQDLEIIVIGINPIKGKPFEEDVIVKYWEDWFTAMNIKKFYIKGADLPSNLDPVIRKIILEKK